MTIELIKQGAVAHIVMGNPPVNVFTPELHRQFHDCLAAFYADDSLKVGIWRTTGDRAFCAGDDIKSARPNYSQSEILQRHFGDSEQLEELGYPGWEREVLRMKRSKPLIAAVQGACVGHGLIYLLLMTDLRIASSKARFGFPEITYGMGGAAGATQLGQQIPHTAAMYMVLSGEMVDADFALRNHLVNEVVDSSQLLSRAGQLAANIAKHPSLALQVELDAYQHTRNLTREQALSYVEHLYRLQRTAYGSQPPLAVDKGASGDLSQ